MRYQLPIAMSFVFTTVFNLSGCKLNTQPQPIDAPALSQAAIEQQQAYANGLIEEYEQWQLSSSPMLQAYRGLKTNYHLWDDFSESFQQAQLVQQQTFLDRLNTLNVNALPHATALSVALLKQQIEQSIAHEPFHLLHFALHQLQGLHSEIPNFLINIHQVDTIEDARHYIARVKGTAQLINQLIAHLKRQEAAGIRPPQFVYDAIITTSERMISGFPLQKENIHNIIWADFLQKIAPLDLYAASEKVLTDSLSWSLRKRYLPAYNKLIAHLKQQRDKASADTGLHQFEQGKAFYALRLNAITTTTMDAPSIHQLGLDEIARIKDNIRALLPQLNQPSLDALFDFTRNDKTLYFDSSEQAITQTKQFIKKINGQLSQAFQRIPDVKMQVLPVESYREDSAPIAFYQRPSDDGKRPGRYYMNGAKLKQMPAFQFEALAYHETLPGHHLQIIYAQQSRGIPEFRRHLNFTAYAEGWGLYAETLAKELGGYQDPWHEYGRLLMALWRANRLVIDTGLHYYGWDIEQAVAFRLANTPFSKEDSLNAIKRYLVMPGQATAYKIGELKLLELREKAKKALGWHFDLPAYHEFILTLGPLPFDLLEQEINAWVLRQKA